MGFPVLTDPSGALISINPANVIDIKPYGYNNNPAEPLPSPHGIQTKIVWLWPGDSKDAAMMTQTFCREAVEDVIAQLNA